MLISDIQIILNEIKDFKFTDYIVYKLISIYYFRSQQGLDLTNYLRLLLEVEKKYKSLGINSSADFLKYLQGCIRNYLEEINGNKDFKNA